jgi:hypothetical protein
MKNRKIFLDECEMKFFSDGKKNREDEEELTSDCFFCWMKKLNVNLLQNK